MKRERGSEPRLPDFPAECLPPALAAQARAIANVCRVPLAMSAPMILATASASLGRGVRVCALPGRVTPPNLFVLVCKTSGSGGSLTFNHATTPLVGVQKTLRREFEENEKPRLDAERADLAQQIEVTKRGLKGAADDDRSTLLDTLTAHNSKLAELEKRSAGRLLYVTDVTPEKLAEMLMEQGEALAHLDSDAADALGIILGTRYGKGDHTQDSLWLKSFTGEPVAIFRKNGEPIHLDAPCLAVLFVATPDKVQELFRTPRLTSGGLLPRFLACDPGARPMPLDGDDDAPHALPTEAAQSYEAAIFTAVQRYRISAEDDPDDISITPGARQLVRADWNRFCAAASEGADSPFEARHVENAIRIALVLHAFRHIAIEQRAPGTYGAKMHGHEHPLDEETMRNALTIRDWFSTHQRAFLAPQRVAADDASWEKAEELVKPRAREVGITARDLYIGHRVCRDAASAERLLSEWKEEGRIESFEREHKGAGRPATAYRLVKRPRT